MTMPPHPMQVEDMPRSLPKSRFRPKQRISHTKSRNGCYTCKQRRVKCDEERPMCGACFVRGEDCVFPDPGGTRDLRRRQPPSSRERPSTESLPLQTRENILEVPFRPLSFSVAPSEESQYVGDQPRSSLNMSDLNLLQHYILFTSKKMTLHKIKLVVWERVIPEMAAANEFLMHLVLALAGLDILTSGDDCAENVQGSSSCSMSAGVPQLRSIMEHHQKGLAGLQEALSATKVPDAEALLAGSMLVVGFAFASFGVNDLDPSKSTLQNALNQSPASPAPLPDARSLQIQWLHLVRGVTSILRQFWSTLRKCRLRSLLDYSHANDDWKLCEEQVRSTIGPSPNVRSKRLRKFANGASRAVSDLRDLQATLRQFSNSEEGADGSPFATPQSDQTGYSGQPLLDAYEQAIDVVDDLYMRILYVMQMTPLDSHSSSDLDLQKDLEDAALSSWPHLLPEKFISSLDWQGDLDMLHGVGLVILAHLYLTIAILEELWFCGKRCDTEIHKISSLIVALGDEKLVSLMDWPIDVIRRRDRNAS